MKSAVKMFEKVNCTPHVMPKLTFSYYIHDQGQQIVIFVQATLKATFAAILWAIIKAMS